MKLEQNTGVHDRSKGQVVLWLTLIGGKWWNSFWNQSADYGDTRQNNPKISVVIHIALINCIKVFAIKLFKRCCSVLAQGVTEPSWLDIDWRSEFETIVLPADLSFSSHDPCHWADGNLRAQQVYLNLRWPRILFSSTLNPCKNSLLSQWTSGCCLNQLIRLTQFV